MLVDPAAFLASNSVPGTLISKDQLVYSVMEFYFIFFKAAQCPFDHYFTPLNTWSGYLP